MAMLSTLRDFVSQRKAEPDPRPYVELAKYCEWQCNDLEQAQMWTAWALHNQQSAPTRFRSPQAIGELEQASHAVSKVLYESSQSTSGPDAASGAATGEAASGSTEGDDAIDAEFEVKE